MADNKLLESIIAPPADSLADWEEVRQHLASLHRLEAVAGCDAMVRSTLAQWPQSFLNLGSFSRVYVLDQHRVLKFCRDLASLQIMERLGAQSRFFPKVELVLADQATQGEQVYHVAVVERLQEGYPRWIASLIDGYRQPYRADIPLFASCRLLELSARILAGGIVVPPDDVVELARAMRLLAVECENEGCLADLRTEQNVMLRSGREAVIADPTHPLESDDW